MPRLTIVSVCNSFFVAIFFCFPYKSNISTFENEDEMKAEGKLRQENAADIYHCP